MKLMIYIILYVILTYSCLLRLSEAQCSSDCHWFGDVPYLCRCADGVACDVISGVCPGDCADGWFGPACQYVSSGYTASDDSSSLDWLTDNNDATCNDAGQVAISVTLDKWILLSWLRLVVKSSEDDQLKITYYINGQSTTCGADQIAKVDSTTLDLSCQSDITVSQFSLTGSGTAGLCSLYISSGHNIALGQTGTTQSTTYTVDGFPYSSNLGVDGLLPPSSSVNAAYCTYTQFQQGQPAWWSLTFADPVNINSISIYNRIDCCVYRLVGFSLTIYDENNINMYAYTEGTGRALEVFYIDSIGVRYAKKIQITLPAESGENILTLCEVAVYGDVICPEGMYGLRCENPCDCANGQSCIASTGGCPASCTAGATEGNCGLSTSTIANEPSTSTIANEPSTSTIANEPSTSTIANEPSTSTIANEPSTSTTTNEPSTSTIANEPSTSTTTNEPSTSTIANEPSTSTIANEPSTSTIANKPSTSTMANEPTPATISIEPSTSTSSSEPSTTTSNSSVPVVTVIEPPSSVNEGTAQVTLTAKVTSEPTVTSVSWVKGGTVLVVSANPVKYGGGTPSDPSLTIYDVDREDTDVYTLEVTNSVGSGFSSEVYLNVVYLPTLTVPTQPITIAAGKDVLLTCAVEADPVISSVAWFKVGGVQLSATSDPTKVIGGTVSDTNLTILNTDSSDAGGYFCQATNDIGTSTSEIVSLTVTTEPPYQSLLATPMIMASVEETLTFSVEVFGYPVPEVWNLHRIRNGSIESAPQRHSVRYIESTQFYGSLEVTLKDLTTEDFTAYIIAMDNGLEALNYTFTLYEVQASPQLGKSSSEVTLSFVSFVCIGVSLGLLLLLLSVCLIYFIRRANSPKQHSTIHSDGANGQHSTEDGLDSGGYLTPLEHQLTDNGTTSFTPGSQCAASDYYADLSDF